MIDAMQVNKNIILVDDDEAVCHALSVFLEDKGYRLRVDHSAEAYSEVETGATEGIMLLDQRMTGMTGMELQTELTKRGINIPIIFITASEDAQIYEKAINAGAVNCLIKPFSNQDLLDSISEALSED